MTAAPVDSLPPAAGGPGAVPTAGFVHALTVEQVAANLSTDLGRGLASGAVSERLQRYGPNELPEPPRPSRLARLARQLAEPMALLLVAAALVAGVALGEVVDAVAILAIVVINALIALLEEGRAAAALDSLRRLEAPRAVALRDGHVSVVAAADLVPGDVVVLQAGDRVPADVRLASASGAEVDESSLTGESLPVTKDAAVVCPSDAVLGDRRNMAFSGTAVTSGQATGIVTATGSDTHLGRIAASLAGPDRSTPLQRQLAQVTRRLGFAAVVIAAGVFALSMLLHRASAQALEQSFLSAVALAVAAVPEGLATVTVVTLALGVRRMAARGAIVRRLPAVETLGSTTVIAVDKTGTLTENRMRVASVIPVPRAVGEVPLAGRMRQVAALCNDATLEPPTGDPMEVALLAGVGDSGVRALQAAMPRMAVAGFTSDRRRMSTLHRDGDGYVVLTKGAVEVVLPLCTRMRGDAGNVEMPAEVRARVQGEADAAAARGGRVLALAWRTLAAVPDDLSQAEHDLTLAGMVVLADPVRPDAAATVAAARGAGLRVIMITGDHPGTALAIADRVGIQTTGGVTTGGALLSARDDLDVTKTNVYARVAPDQKLTLVEALQAGGEVVAMTGDGVNDAPALRRADIGVALGSRCSDVARQAADMVVTDDSMATIVTAVREGRAIYANIRKVVDYLVAGNVSEILVVVTGLVLFPAIGVPLLPLQLLWINLLTDGLPALALSVDPAHDGLMRVTPRRRDDPLLGGRRFGVLALRGAVIAAGPLAAAAVVRLAWDQPWTHTRGVLFTTLVVAHLLYALAARGGTGLARGRQPVNRWLLAAIGAELALQVAITVWGPAQALFGTAALPAREWLLVVAAGALPTLALLALHRPRVSRPVAAAGT